ncbi:MAG TPA: glycosyltransferase family 39 protein [Actinoplanes sp.]|nr:glycosyltransferase family 39 protein [Actinoplanes sp.]
MADVVADRTDDVEADTPARPLARLRASALAAAPAIGLYLAIRIISLEVMYILGANAYALAPDRDVFPDGSTGNHWQKFTSFMDALLSWDARWYTKIATEGWGGPVGAVDEDGVPYELRLVFFPLYPWMGRVLADVTFVSPVTALLMISFVSSIAAAWGLYAIGRHVHSHRVGVLLAAIWAVAPAAMTQNGAFTESLFTALSAWALYSVLKERWVIAGLLAGLSGLSRPTAAALIGTVGLAALIAAFSRRGGWRPYAAMVLAPSGMLLYVAYASSKLGGTDEYFGIHEQTFGAWWDYGENHWNMITDILIGVDDDNAAKPIRVLSFLFMAAFVVLFLLLLGRAPWPLVVFAGVTLLLSIGGHAHMSMAGRHLLPAFPVLLVPAIALARFRTRDLSVVLAVLALLSGWYAGWLPFISGQAI